ncbi:MAG: MAE_28990/MAE_18760 family HEPN-like nuclease [Microcystaceae cyanobacterium]
MKEFIRDFNKRVAEIEKYFELVGNIEQLGAFTSNSIIFPSGEYIVDSDLQKILRSHCYVLLYNLIESSIRNGIVAIHDAIQSDNLTYQDLQPKIQQLWIMNDLTKSFQDRYITQETIANNLKDTLKIILDDSSIFLDANNISISGNLNAEKIHELIEQYGFYGNLPMKDKEIDPIFDDIVKMRCNLAHGNESFTEASNQKTWNELINTKEKLIIYLTGLLRNIETYIDGKKYRV